MGHDNSHDNGEDVLVFAGIDDIHVLKDEVMNLRDYFVGQAISGFVAAHGFKDCSADDLKKAAANAYTLADAIIAARGRAPEPEDPAA